MNGAAGATGAATDRTPAGQRLHDLDAVRGFALLGIFVVNITFMASGYPGNLVTDPAYSSLFDDLARGASAVLVDMKFYILFSFLFGYSFTLQMASAERAGAAFRPRMLRRIAGLFILGALHTVFLYGGDILMTYAVVCLILLGMRRVRDRTALRVAGVLYGIVLLSLLTSGLLVDSAAFLPTEAEALVNAEHATSAMLGGWGDVIGHHLSGLPFLVLQSATFQGPTALAMFLLGMVAGRRRLLAGVLGDEPVLRRIQWIGFPVGIAGGLAYALGGGNGEPLAVAVSAATAPLLTAAYVTTLLRVMHSPPWAFVRSALAPAGRTALTNYLGQSLLGLLIFSGVGLGLAGRVSPAGTTGLALLIFAGQLTASAWWLRRHRYGPAEWALRWLTNGARPEKVRTAGVSRPARDR
ncbi:DUF418 domain-containing protein [Solwaraspora sp. WMMD1047]|uniref:DUF418 domain-containing protein n=1 Tax=Solwaraspora sp. WMMD1047 TaxID=3016102 RepID=UPI002415B1F7|nr:DUF418 domain-containing protein [Solwaraspora sp. WMMD1047]MDG4827955.1 DUF418 domain-containing protein [Solwaraspora sp. WMMD1047]